MTNKYLCLNCLCDTDTNINGTCKVCGREKIGIDTVSQVKMVLESRFHIPDNKRKILENRYDMGLQKAEKYVKTIKTASDIPNERGPLT